MRPYELTTESYTTADTDGIAEAQDTSGAGNLTLVSSTVTLAPPRFVTVTSTGDDTGLTFTVTGTRPGGGVQTDSFAGANAGAATSALTFETVTNIAVSGNTDGNVTAGYTQSGYSDWLPMDIYTPNQVTTVSTTVSGTINYDIQYTNEDPFNRAITQTAVAHPTAALGNASTSQTASSTTLMRALRYKVNSGTGTIRLTITQQSTA